MTITMMLMTMIDYDHDVGDNYKDNGKDNKPAKEDWKKGDGCGNDPSQGDHQAGHPHCK